MTIVIDPTFSVYRMVERLKKSSTLLNHRRTMSVISYEIENATLLDHAHGRVYSSFQRFSKFIPQIPRYQRMAKTAEHIFVFGVPDVTLPPIENITYVPLNETDQLAKEWFLVSYGTNYYGALATEELTDIDDPDDSRVFQGIWTFNLEMVSVIADWLDSALDLKPLIYDASEFNHQRHVDSVAASLRRLLGKIHDRALLTHILQTEIKTALKNGVQPQLVQLKQYTIQEANEQEVVVFFSDIRNFTTLSESMPPAQLVSEIINPYLEAVTTSVYRHGGMVDKLMGDGVLAVFGLDEIDDSKADRALLAARDTMNTLKNHHTPIPTGIGLAGGRVLVGEIGSDVYFEKTIIGDAVNVAQRLSSIGQDCILVSHTIYHLLRNRQSLVPQGEIDLKGKSEPHYVYTLE